MPLVFVHGVNTRAGENYEKTVKNREEKFRDGLAGSDGRPYEHEIFDGYWGDLGAPAEAKRMRSLPGASHVPLGPAADEIIDPEALVDLGDEFLAEIAARSPVDAVDLLVAGALAHYEMQGQPAPDRILKFGVLASSLAMEMETQQRAIEATNNDDVIVRLIRLVQGATPAGPVALGLVSDVVGDLQAGLNYVLGVARSGAAAVAGGARRLGSRLLLAGTRTWLSQHTALFLGDVLVYLGDRGTAEAPGKILKRVGKYLAQAHGGRKAADPLIVVGHSLGGVILYDLLTGVQPTKPLVPGLVIDTLVTVGSQVGVFAELGRYLIQSDTGALAHGHKLSRPPGVLRWINIYDRTDALSFQGKAVFNHVEDYDFSGRTGTLSAHSAYFYRASFYERLGARLREGTAS